MSGQASAFRMPREVWPWHCRLCQASVRPPLLWSGFGPSSVRFSFSLGVSGFARCGLCRCWRLLFSFLFCVPHPRSWLSSLSFLCHFHVIGIFISPTLLRQGVRLHHPYRSKTPILCTVVRHSCPDHTQRSRGHEWQRKRGRFPAPVNIDQIDRKIDR